MNGLRATLVLLLFATGCTDPVKKEEPVSIAAVVSRTEAALGAKLGSDPSWKASEIRLDSFEGVLGTRVVRALAQGAYPGTGAYAVLLDQGGKSYGARGENDLADLVRVRGWLDKPPEAPELVRLVNDGLFDGVMITCDDPWPARTEKVNGALVLTFTRGSFPGGLREKVLVTFPASGPAAFGIVPGK